VRPTRAELLGEAEHDSAPQPFVDEGAADVAGAEGRSPTAEGEAGHALVEPQVDADTGDAPGAGDPFAIAGTFEPGDDEDWKDHVFFDLASAELDSSQKQRLGGIAAALPEGPSTQITLVGYTSEEGPELANDRIASARIDAVLGELVGTYGHEPRKIIAAPRPRASEGRLAYREWRAVEVQTESSEEGPDCSVDPETTSFGRRTRRSFDESLATARDWVSTALAELGRHDASSGLPPAVERLFGSEVALADVVDGITKIQAQLRSFSSNPPILGTDCHGDCQGGIKAFVKNDKEMTLCPAFCDLKPDERARVLAHEAAHFESSVKADDCAYGWERLIEHLPTEKALGNADSYAVLIMRLANADLGEGSEPPTDDTSGLGNAEHEEKAAETIAYVQRWVTANTVIINHLYSVTHKRLQDATPQWPGGRFSEWIEFAADQLGFRLGARPTEEVRATLAGIYDRFRTMMFAMGDESLTFTTTRGDSEWEAGPGTHIAVNPSLWERPLRARIRLLFRRLAAAVPDIPPGQVGGYVNVADRFRQLQGNGP
jgi:outer membrane protein OmpA-like peptidoglycan-associated protein